MNDYKVTNDKSTAVSLTVEWQRLDDVPAGTKVQLLSIGRVAMYGQITEQNKKHFLAWAPAPREPAWLKDAK